MSCSYISRLAWPLTVRYQTVLWYLSVYGLAGKHGSLPHLQFWISIVAITTMPGG